MSPNAELPDVRERVRRVLNDDGDVDAYEATAQAVVAALSAGSPIDLGLTDDERRELYRCLILQDGVEREPPILHTLLANYYSGGSRDVLASAAAELGPTLAALLETGAPAKNLVIMLILLRAYLPAEISQSVVSSLHRDFAPMFTLPDLTLPYSDAFTDVFDRNRADVEAWLSDGGSTIGQMPIVHLLVFEWLTGCVPFRSLAEITDHARTPIGRGPTSASEMVSAARSLIARHGDAADIAASPTDDVVTPELAQLCASIARERLALPRRAAGNRRAAMADGRIADRRWQAVNAGIGVAAQRVDALIGHRRLPVLPGRRRPKIAVCISGQLRGYEQTFETWRRTILRSADCDLYVHTWAKIGRSGAEVFRSNLPFAGDAFTAAYREVALRDGFETVQQQYPTLFRELAASGSVTVDDLKAFYGTDQVRVDDETASPFGEWTNQQKMHFKIEACFAMAEESGQEYDLVVRLRPDKPIGLTAFAWGDLLTACRSSPTIFADLGMGVHYANLLIGDQFAIGSPSSMRVYSRAWTLYPEIAANGLLQCPPGYEGHASLAQVCWVHGIDVKKAPLRFGALAEAAVMSTDQILRCLEADSSGRMDDADRELLRAAQADAGR